MLPAPADAIAVSTLNRALVIQLRHHGDVLLTSPVFAALKRAAPQIEIDALVYAETREMLDGHPAIAQLHAVDRNWKRQNIAARLACEWRLFSALRARGYDILIHLSEHPRGAWLARMLGPRFAVAPNFAATSAAWKKSFTHRFVLPRNAHRHKVEWNLDALRRIGVQPAEEDRGLVLVPGAEAERHVEFLLAGHEFARKTYIHVHPASRWLFKCWPAERTAELIDALASRGERIVLTAAPQAQELALVAAIREHARSQLVDLSGQLTLKQLAALTARAKLFIGVDSAPMHIAAAVGTPVVALFGPSGELEWGPWRVPYRVVTSNRHPCRPCGNDGCGGGKVSECLTQLPLDAVLSAAESLLR